MPGLLLRKALIVVLARYGALVKPPAWEPPPPEITELKALITRLEAIEADMRRELNRIEKATLTGVPTAVRESLKKSVSFLKEEKARLEKTIREHIDQHPTLKQDRHLSESIPAVGPKTAWRMLTLLRARTFTRAPSFGNLTVVLNRSTRHIEDSFYDARENVLKNNDARVSMRPFLDPEFGFVSAVLHSAADCVNRPPQLGDDFSVLHNPLASHPFNPSTFDWCDQYFYRDGVLDKRLANSAWSKRSG